MAHRNSSIVKGEPGTGRAFALNAGKGLAEVDTLQLLQDRFKCRVKLLIFFVALCVLCGTALPSVVFAVGVQVFFHRL
jgi:hypothetical protein